MISRAAHFVAVIVVLTGFVLIVVALSTTDWIKASVQVGDILDAIANRTGQRENTMHENQIFRNTMICIKQGLFKVSKTIGWSEKIISVDFVKLPRFVIFGIVVLNLASVYCVIGMVLLISAISASYGDRKDQITANKRTGMAVISMIIAGILITAAMAEYCKETIDIIGKTGSWYLNITVPDHSWDFVNSNPVDITPKYGYSFALGWASVVIMMLSVAIASLSRLKSEPERQESQMDQVGALLPGNQLGQRANLDSAEIFAGPKETAV